MTLLDAFDTIFTLCIGAAVLALAIAALMSED